MAKCSICGKSVLFGNAVSHSHRRSNKMFKPNVKKVKVSTPSGNKRIYVCTSCLRSGRVERAVREPALSLDSIVIEESVLAELSVPESSGEALTEAAGAVAEAATVAEAAEEAVSEAATVAEAAEEAVAEAATVAEAAEEAVAEAAEAVADTEDAKTEA